MKETTIRVLYVDDESTLLDLCKTYLERLGEFAVTTVSSAPEAIRILELERFDGIISDYQMPEMDGIEFLKVVRARGDKTPFIIFTGKGREDVVIEALNSGADFYLQKGGEPKSQFAELSHKIKKAVESRLAEKAFKESEDRFRSLFDGALDMIQIIRPDGSFLHVNPAWKKTLGYSDDDVRTMSVFDIFHPDSLTPCSIKFGELLSGPKAINIEAQFLTKDKKVISVEGNCNPEKKDGTVVSIRGIFHDVTERKQAETAQRETNEYLHKLIDFANAPIIVWNPDFAITRFNHAFERLTGRVEQEVIGQPLDILFPEETRDASLARIKKTVTGERWETVEIPILASDGTIHTVLWNTANILTAEAELISTIAQGVDITDRKRAEDTLRKSEEKFRSLVEHALEGILILDLQGTILFANNATARTLETDDRAGLIGRNVMEFVAPESREDVAKDFVEVSLGHDAYLAQYNVISAKGNKFTVESVGKVISYEGKPADLVSFRDITIQKKAQEALVESEERFRALVENTTDIIRILDREGRIVFETAAADRELGYPHGYTLGRDPFEFIHPDDLMMVKQELSQVYRKTNDGVPTEFRIRRADGSYTWVESVGKNLIGVPGVDGIVVTTRFIDERKMAEDALKENQARLDLALRSAGMGVWHWNIKTNKRYFDAQTCHLLGIDPVTFSGSAEEFFSVVHPDDRERLKEALARTVEQDVLYEPLYHVVWSDGSIHYITARGRLVKDAEGQPERINGIIWDITERRQGEEALRESEKQYHSILDSMQDAYVRADTKGQIIMASPSAASLFRYDSVNELIGLPAVSLYRNMEERQEIIRIAKEQGEVHDFICEGVRKDGTSFWASINVQFTVDSNGKITGTDGFIRDITERKRAEEELQIAHEKYTKAFLAVPDAITISELDSGQFTEVNDAASRIFGYSRDELVGKSTLELGIWRNEEDRDRLIDEVRKYGKVSQYEVLNRRKSGELFNAIVNADTISIGNVSYLISVIRDITDQKRADDALRESEKKSRSLLEHVPELILVHRNGIILYSNPAAMISLGYQPHEVIGRQVLDFVAPEFHERVAAAVRRRMSDNPVEPYEIEVMGKDGSRRTMVVNGSTIEFDGAPAFLIILTDITARKKAEEALMESKREFADIISFLPDATLVIDKNGTVLAWNRAMEEMTGVPAEQILGKADYEYALPFYHERRPITVDLVLHEDPAIAAKYPFMKQESGSLVSEIFIPHLYNGRGAFLWFKASPLYDAAGNITGAIESIRDITDKKQAEEALRDAHEKYTKAFLSAPDAIAISDLDSGRFIEVNDAATRMFGYSRDELIGKNALELGILLNKEDREHLIDQVRKQGRVSQFEILERRKSGELYNALINADTVSIGNVPYLITIVQDITDRKRAEEALQESEERYSSIFDNNYSVSLLINPDTGKIVDANVAAVRYYGYPYDVLTSKGIYDLNRLPKEKVIGNLQRAKDQKAKHFFSTHYLATGEKRNVEIYSGPITLQKKPLFYSIIHDITDRKRAEEALRESETRYREFFTISRDSIFITSPEGRWIDFNDAIVEMFGYESRKEMFEVPVQSIYADPKERIAFTQRIEREGFVKEYPVRGKKKDGTVIDTIITTVPVRNPDGSLKAFIGTIRNVTEQNRAEQEIRTLQQFQQSIIDNANVWFSVLDPEGTILVWNITAEQISGYPAKDVIGKNTIWKQLYPDPVYRKQVAENILDIIKKNTYVENFETRIRTKSGDEKIIWWNTQPMRDTSGKPVQFITIGRDNTERKHSEENLRALRQFEESVIKNANIWISVLDGKGNVSVWNRAAEEISGYPADEVIGKNTIWSRMYPDKDYRRSVTATIKEVIGARKYLENFETRIRTKDGQERIIWWNTRALQDVPGIDETFIAIGKDVTEQMALQNAISQANKKLNLLSNITRHDIVNQLLALNGYLELSQDLFDDPVKLKEYITKEQRIANTIEAQIQFTKDYQDMGIKAPEWQNVHKTVDMAISRLPLRGIAVDTDNPDLEVYADPLLGRVFYNLIDNALRYGGEQMTTIRISSQESDRGLVLICEDNGVGIPADKKEAIFIRGYFKHTGFGLFLSQEILAITGITIAETGEPGKGARFEMTVPIGGWRFGKGTK